MADPLAQYSPQNILNVIQKLESRIKALEQSYVSANSADEMVDNLGQLDFRAKDVNGQLRMIMSAISLLEELGIEAHFAGLDANGTAQFYISADTGKGVFGGGKVTLGADGIMILSDGTALFTFYTEDGNTKIAELFHDGAGNLQLSLADNTKAFTINNGNVIVNHGTDVNSAYELYENNVKKSSWVWDAANGNVTFENFEDLGNMVFALKGDDKTERVTIHDRAAGYAAFKFHLNGAQWMREQSSAPPDPDANYAMMYPKDDGTLHYVLSDGTDKDLTAGAAGGTTTGFSMINGALVASVASNALTIAIKNLAGNDPSAGDPVKIIFRNPTAATGDYAVITLTAATSFVVSSGSTLGTIANTAFRLWIVGFNDGGTFRLGVVDCLSGENIYPLRDDVLASSTAEGGAGAADVAQVIYTGSAVTTKAMRILGYAEYSSGLATAGTWASAPTKLQLFHHGISLPGQEIQQAFASLGTVATGTKTIPADNTIPQITEGNEYITATLTPTSPANLLKISSQIFLSNSGTGGGALTSAIFRDAAANAIKCGWVNMFGANTVFFSVLKTCLLAASITSTTLRLRAGYSGAGTTTVNGAGGSQFFGGVMNTYLEVKELMT